MPSIVGPLLCFTAMAAAYLVIAFDKSDMARNVPIGNILRADGFNIEEAPNLDQKVAVVTGASSGLGEETVRYLAQLGAIVVMACRDLPKASLVRNKILEEFPSADVRMFQLDLEDIKQVDTFATKLLDEFPTIDILINNAGMSTKYPPTLTTDGLETTFQVNFLSHFHLTRRLLGALKSAKGARVVWLTSSLYRVAPTSTWLHETWHNNFTSFGLAERYAVAKLACLWAAKEFNTRHGDDVYFNAVHPGVVATSILRDPVAVASSLVGPRFAEYLGPIIANAKNARDFLLAYSPRKAALTQVFVAVSPKITKQKLRGEYFVPIATKWPVVHDSFQVQEFGNQFWQFSTALADDLLKRN
eukprot:m.147303 g.147303  ORF g.147303 m.147303 type:complete len:359 (+) comp30527_c0_seq1:193-1269(+)